MATIDKAPSTGGGVLAFIHDERVRSVFYQLVTGLVVAYFAWYLFDNTTRNLESRGMSSGFDFIWLTAGFDTDFTLIEYTAGNTYGRVFVVGMLNTLFVSLIAIVLATILGFFMGVMRLSRIG